MTDYVTLYDSTLRDGAQSRGVDFTVADKIAIARELDKFGIDYIEGGWPGANPNDDEFFASAPPLKKARLSAFGMTRRAGRSAENDPGLATLLDSGAKSICLVGKSWDHQVKSALGISTVAAVGYLGLLSGPPVIGLLAQAFSLHRALLLVAALAALDFGWE